LNARFWGLLFATGTLVSACRTTWVIVPHPSGGYRADTLRATLDGRDARVIFRFDTITHTQYIRVTDTLWREGTHFIHDTLRLVRRDTVRLIRHDTVRVVRRDTVRYAGIMAVHADTVRLIRVDTVRIGGGTTRVDTVRISGGPPRVDTVRIHDGPGGQHVDTVRVPVEVTRIVQRTDTLRVFRTDTFRIVRTDTVRVTRVDTLRVAADTVRLGGHRVISVPPGQYPPAGLCRVWIADKPPGLQRRPEACQGIADIPAGAFVLFGGEAWDFDYDWVADGHAPPQIIALKRAKGRKP
jgi:hypothetical protein